MKNVVTEHGGCIYVIYVYIQHLINLSKWYVWSTNPPSFPSIIITVSADSGHNTAIYIE